jgi:hypothetical protein
VKKTTGRKSRDTVPLKKEKVKKQSRVGIHRGNYADFTLDLRNCYSELRLYIGFTH